MYFTQARTLEWATQVAETLRTHPAVRPDGVEFFTVPSFLSIPSLVPLLAPHPVGAQDLATADSGAYTGEVSGRELAEIGVKLAEVGHAERRRLFGETDEIVAAKTLAALRNGLDVILCVGEQEHTDPLQAVENVADQVMGAVEPARSQGLTGRILVAYEPQWAIGAPQPAPPEYIRAVCAPLAERFAQQTAFDFRVLYGGSAGPGLLPEIAPAVDGLFLGRFAHDPAAVSQILDEAATLLEK